MRRMIIMALAAGSVMFFLVSCSPQGQGKAVENKVEEANVIDVNNEYCPVTGEKIKDDQAVTYVYEGKRYRFCCVNCIVPFKKNPQKYIKIIEEGKYPSGDSQMH